MKKKIIITVVLAALVVALAFGVRYITTKYTEHTQDTTNQTNNIDDTTKAVVEVDSDLIGILHIPSVGLEPTPLYRYATVEEAQPLSDKEDTAVATALYSWRNKDVHRIEFGDHNYQNFGPLKLVEVGNVAFIKVQDKVVRMTCVSATLSETLDEYNESIIRDHETVTTVTCYGNDTRTVVRWKITDDSDITFDELFWIVGKYRVAQRDSSFADKNIDNAEFQEATDPTQVITQDNVGEKHETKVIYDNTQDDVDIIIIPEYKIDEEATYIPVNETVYALSHANIRKGPGSEYELFGKIHEGGSITRVGIGNNGWSQVEYEGEVLYISSYYLTTEPVNN